MSKETNWERSTRGQRPRLVGPQYISYFFSEGKNSEPFYADLVKSLSVKSTYISAGDLTIDHSISGRQGKILVCEVEKKVAHYQCELQKRHPEKHISNVWICFDFDNLQPQEYQGAFTEISRLNDLEKAKKSFRIHWWPCWSSYCFEEWLLLHFAFCEAALNESELEAKLSSYISKEIGKDYKYNKSDSKIFSKIFDVKNMLTAIKYSRKLNKEALAANQPWRNPSTGVSEFAAYYLKNFLERKSIY
jgi:hypothetical protein